MEKSLSFISRVFNLRPGDFGRGLPLFAYYFLVISSYSMARAARDSLFLDRFKAVQLPYADIAIAALVGFIVAFYIRIGRQSSLRNLQVATLLLFALSFVGFWWELHTYRWIWLSPTLYVWVGIYGVIAVTQVWTIANFVCTTREAKRLFAMLGSGGIAGGIAGGFLTKWITPRFGTESLLLLIATFIAASAALVPVIWKQRALISEGQEAPAEEGPKNLFESFKLVRGSSHLQAIAALICLSSVVTTAAGWQLKAIAKDTFEHKDALAAFFGTFQAYAGIATLGAQLLLTSKVLRYFGVGVGLLVLPLSLTAGSAAVAVWGTLWAATLLKGSDQVFRYSIDTSALQLLYLPVSAHVKLQVKSFLDTVVWRFGDGLAGLTLLVFATNLRFTARQISWVNVALLGLWIIAAVVAQRQYVATLRSNIQQIRIQPGKVSVPVLDQFTSNVVAEKLNSNDVNEIIYGLDLFEMAQHVNAHSAVKNLLEHPSPHVRKKAISILNYAQDLSVRQQIAGMITDNSLEVRTEALLYLSRHEEMDPLTYVDKLGDFADFSVRSATVSFLMKPGEGQNLVAARMILDGIVQDLANPALASDAARTLDLLGDLAVDSLRDHLWDSHAPLEMRRQIPEVLLRIGTPRAGVALAENLVQAEPDLRSRVIVALNKLCEFQRSFSVDKQLVESAMMAEMMGHYRSYQILGTSNGDADETLKQTLAEELERIFRLMKLMFPSLDLQNAYLGIRSSDPVTHANALEFLDNTLNPNLRARLVPLIDSEVSTPERIKLADRFLGFSVQA
jgi:AAA family ATP:ADP antiporter